LPNTQVLNGNPLQSGGGQPMFPDPSTALAAPTHTLSSFAAVMNAVVTTGSAVTIPAAVPTTTTNIAASIKSMQTVTITAPLSPALVSGVRYDPASESTEELGNQAAPFASDDADVPAASPTAPSTLDAETVARDACLAAVAEEAATLPASAPAVAEATTESWTPNGALAAVSVLFAGQWLRWHSPHARREERKHHLERPATPKKK
jgi:hypothetical protein